MDRPARVCTPARCSTPPATSRPRSAVGAFGDAGLTAFGDGCATAGAGGLTGGLTVADPAAGSIAEVAVYVPPGLSLTGVALTRATHGFAGEPQPGNPQRYTATTDPSTSAGTLESRSLADGSDLSGRATFPVTSSSGAVRLRLDCAYTAGPGGCPAAAHGPVSFDVSSVALHVTDEQDPRAAVSHSPAAGEMEVHASATDDGAGLWDAQVLIDGAPAAVKSFGGTRCSDLSPGDGTVDLPIDADCPHVAGADLKVPTAGYADGAHALVVRVSDAAGRTWQRSETITVANHIDPGQRSRTLTIGSAVPGQPGANGSGSGGVAGASATSCRSPKLSMMLNQTPLRVSHGVPVLERNRTYRFKGRLTCVVRHHRVSGPRHARIDLLNVVGKRTVEKNGTTVRAAGRITLILRYRSSRTLIFRFVNGDGRRAQVKIKIRIAS